MRILLDTGPWVALLCRSDSQHVWARDQFAQLREPLLTCEAVVAETCFLLARNGFDPAAALAFIERGAIEVGLSLQAEASAIRQLFQRYGNVPASLADACLIRLSELHEPCKVLTLDSDFQVYRRHGRKAIALISPSS